MIFPTTPPFKPPGIPQPHLMTLSQSLFVLFQVSDIDSSSLRNTVPGKGYFVIFIVGFVVCNPRTPQDLKRKVGYPHNFRTSIQTNSQPLLSNERNRNWDTLLRSCEPMSVGAARRRESHLQFRRGSIWY